MTKAPRDRGASVRARLLRLARERGEESRRAACATARRVRPRRRSRPPGRRSRRRRSRLASRCATPAGTWLSPGSGCAWPPGRRSWHRRSTARPSDPSRPAWRAPWTCWTPTIGSTRPSGARRRSGASGDGAGPTGARDGRAAVGLGQLSERRRSRRRSGGSRGCSAAQQPPRAHREDAGANEVRHEAALLVVAIGGLA